MSRPLSLRRKIRNFTSDQKAVAAVEFALVVPVMVMLIMGTVEITRYIMFHQRIDFAATSLVNMLNQNLNVYKSDLTVLHNAAARMMENSFSHGTVFTAIQQNSPPPVGADVMWQEHRGRAYAVSLIAPGGAGSKVTLPNLPLYERDQVVSVEITARFRPLAITRGFNEFLGVGPIDVYKWSMARPRYGAFQFPPR
jgi:Flp pilus assembly pilin Flp